MNEYNREVDFWIRRMAIIGPIIAFVVGWGSGILTAAVLYRDHEKRIQNLESFQREQIICHTQLAAEIAKVMERIRIK